MASYEWQPFGSPDVAVSGRGLIIRATRYRCAAGHETTWPFYVSCTGDDGSTIDSVHVCPICFMAWLREHAPLTHPIPDDERTEADADTDAHE